MRVVLTGARGFLGEHLSAGLRAEGHEICGTSSREVEADGGQGFRLQRWRLEEAFPEELLEGADLLVHLAFAKGRELEALNVEGTLRALEAGKRAGVRQQLFLSSFSARPDAVSGYGRMKAGLEQRFRDEGMLVVRPGLVVGPGGLFAGMVRSVRRLPVLPLPDGGRRPVPLLGVDDFVSCTMQLIVAGEPGTWTLCYPEQPSLRELLVTIAKCLGRRRLPVAFPTSIGLAAVRVAGWLGLSAGVDTENLRAYRVNTPDLHATDFPSFGLPVPSLHEIVDRAVRGLAERARTGE